MIEIFQTIIVCLFFRIFFSLPYYCHVYLTDVRIQSFVSFIHRVYVSDVYIYLLKSARIQGLDVKTKK